MTDEGGTQCSKPEDSRPRLAPFLICIRYHSSFAFSLLDDKRTAAADDGNDLAKFVEAGHSKRLIVAPGSIKTV